MAAFGRDGRTPGLAGQVFVRDGEWTEYVLRYTPDENTPIPCGLRLGVAQVGRGTLWVDEIEMVPAE